MNMNSKLKLHIIGLILFVLFLPETGLAKNVVLPITIDYPLLKELVVSQWFNSPEKEYEVLNDPNGCRKIVISEPDFSEENSLLRFEIKVRVKAGFYFLHTCFLPVEWEGYVVFFQTPVVEPENWMLSLKTHDSFVLDKKHKPALISGAVWKLIKKHVHTYVDDGKIDLSPPVNEMKSFLVEIFPEKMQSRAEMMIQSMKPGNIEIQDKAVQIGIDTDISSVEDSTRTIKDERLDDAELAVFINAWETTDDFIVYMVGSLSNDLLNEDEKQMILETLLDTRYRFVAELTSSIHENDFVKKQFMATWESLSVLFRNHIRENPGASALGYLAFFSSMDALKILDSMGPSMGIEISRNGLVRLAGLISDKKAPLLFYSTEINEKLRQIMGLEPLLKESSERIRDEHENNKKQSLDTVLDKLLSMFKKTIFINPLSEAVAAEQNQTGTMHLEKWLPPRTNVSEYVNNIRQLLKKASDNTISKSKLDPEYHDLLHVIVDAVAWQESCFRQFEVRNGKIEYLRSYNNTSVGAMQINERVWRGIYDLQKLRWDIHYNIDAGSEIIDLFLNKYIFRKMKENNYKALENKDNIARSLYAIYNGGPGQFVKFLERISKEKFYLSDTLFYEKYLWVKNNQWENADICLVGE